jgi:hypothetical protein
MGVQVVEVGNNDTEAAAFCTEKRMKSVCWGQGVLYVRESYQHSWAYEVEFITDGVSRISDHFPLYGMKILLGNFSAVLGREDMFTSVTGNDSLYANNNGSSVKSFKPRYKQRIISSTVLQHRSFIVLCFYKWLINTFVFESNLINCIYYSCVRCKC